MPVELQFCAKDFLIGRKSGPMAYDCGLFFNDYNVITVVLKIKYHPNIHKT